MAAEQARAPRKRGVLIALLVAGAALLTAGAVGIVTILTAPADGPLDMRGNPVRVEGAIASPQAIKAMKVTEDTGDRFVVPSVGLDVPLGALSVADGEITPPGFASAYLVRDLGTSPKTPEAGTVYVAMHSVRGGGVGPGNYLMDVDKGGATVATGAAIEVGGVTYTVTGSSTVAKKDLPKDASLWTDTPGRLVVITCLQVPSGSPSTENVVITAERQK